MMHSDLSIRKIAYIGNYLPRQCGIATFTTSLCETTALLFPEIQCFSVPVTDTEEGYDYPERVRFEIKEKDLSSYERAADFLNINNVDIACLQHEFGIFGGTAGGHILILLRRLKMPVITTLHTILTNPNEQQTKVMEQIIELSDRVVVMTKKAAEILKNHYKIDNDKLTLIPHGILDIPFVDPNFYKDVFGVEGKIVLLTFGLLAPDKGVEYVIKALPTILKAHPDTVYIILGATHPNLIRHEGETYRLKLQYLAEDLGVEKNVFFHNRFVSSEELKEFIGASDIYITPYLNEAQITSGTLSYSFGAGKAVISTPYWHASELLADGRGRLVPFKDSESIAQEVNKLIENETERHAMRKNAYLMSREMVWNNVAYLYRKTFEEARLFRLKSVGSRIKTKVLESHSRLLPRIKLDHLFRLSDSIGIYKNAILTIPDFSSGYCTNDNASALILAVLLEDAGFGSYHLTDLASKCLSFLSHAFNKETGRFRSGLNFDRSWCEDVGSEETHGYALWALGTCIGRSKNEGFQGAAGQLFELSLPASYELQSPLGWALTLMGIHEYFRKFDGDRLVNHGRELLAGKLYDLYTKNSSPDFPWFESSLNTNNAKLPHALILSGRWLVNNEMLTAGLNSLDWLLKIQTSAKGCYRSIQNTAGIDQENDKEAIQKPIEAHAIISACLEAYRTTQNKIWFNEARKTFEWFIGRNDIGLPLYDSKTGGCRDSLHIDRVNRNEGAEASIAFYLSLIEMQSMENTIASFHEPIPT
jgi:glycosyltransferase involved in cell wall biosynthesis